MLALLILEVTTEEGCNLFLPSLPMIEDITGSIVFRCSYEFVCNWHSTERDGKDLALLSRREHWVGVESMLCINSFGILMIAFTSTKLKNDFGK